MTTSRVLRPTALHASEALVDSDLDRRARFLTTCVGDDARAARNQVDAATVAADVMLIKKHRPLVVEVVASSDLDGGDVRELAVLGPNGGPVGLLPPRVLCHAHRDAVDWPCEQISALARRHRERTGFDAADWRSPSSLS